MTNAANTYRRLTLLALALFSLLAPSYVHASLSHRTALPFPDRAQHAAQHNLEDHQGGHHITSNPQPTWRVGARDVGKAAAARRWVGASPPDAELAWTRFRCFDAETGTWISTDPLEVAGGWNLYALDGSPSDVVDPLGLSGTSGGNHDVDLTEHRRDHILNRHRAGAGKPSKTEFPATWSDDEIIHNVSDVATDPNATRGMGKWNSPFAIATRDGVDIRVDFYPDDHPTHAGKISTAYPINTTPNPP